jgi:hypothetical protein
MASETEIAYATAAAMLDNSFNALLNGGAGDAVVAIYTGGSPANCEAAPTGTLLGVCKFMTTPFQAAADQAPNARIQVTASISDDVSADTTGVAGHFRATISADGVTPDAAAVIQGSAGEAADSTDLTLDDKNIVVGGTISITAYDITQPEA